MLHFAVRDVCEAFTVAETALGAIARRQPLATQTVLLELRRTLERLVHVVESDTRHREPADKDA